MAKKKEIDKVISEIKKNLDTKNIVIGTDRTIKLLKQGKLEKIFVTTNCPKKVKEDIEQYSKIAGGVEVIDLEYPNDELSVICKKPFSISI